MVISTGFVAFFNAASGQVVLLPRPRRARWQTAESPVGQHHHREPRARPLPQSTACPHLPRRSPLAAGYSMADGAMPAASAARASRRCGCCSPRSRRWRSSPPPRSPPSGRSPSRNIRFSASRTARRTSMLGPITEPAVAIVVGAADQLVVGDLEVGVLGPVVLHRRALGRRRADREVPGADRPGGHVLGRVEELQELPRRRLLRGRRLVHHEQLTALHEHATAGRAGAGAGHRARHRSRCWGRCRHPGSR